MSEYETILQILIRATSSKKTRQAFKEGKKGIRDERDSQRSLLHRTQGIYLLRLREIQALHRKRASPKREIWMGDAPRKYHLRPINTLLKLQQKHGKGNDKAIRKAFKSVRTQVSAAGGKSWTSLTNPLFSPPRFRNEDGCGFSPIGYLLGIFKIGRKRVSAY